MISESSLIAEGISCYTVSSSVIEQVTHTKVMAVFPSLLNKKNISNLVGLGDNSIYSNDRVREAGLVTARVFCNKSGGR